MDNKLKQRLIGASVLVALGVIIIPELIKDPFEQTDPAGSITAPQDFSEKPGLTISLPAAEQPQVAREVPATVSATARETAPPSKPETSETVRAETAPSPPPDIAEPPTPVSPPAPVKPLTPPTEANTAEVATSPPPAPVKPTAPPAEIETARTPAPEPSPAPKPPAPETDQQATAKAAPRTTSAQPVELPKIQLVGRSMSGSPPEARGGWTVQVGSFSNEANARELSAKLRSQRFPASVEPVKVNNRVSYRVRVGKQASRAASEKMLARMEQETGVTGKVMSIGN